jgi:mannonate dehydratase
VKLLLRHMGAVGIPVWCYEFMAVHGWLRTSTMIPARGGALVTGYDHRLMQKGGLTDAGVVTEQRLWDNYAYFLERVLPVAEEAKVKLALHPDDPPLSPIRGVGRIMRSLVNFDRALALANSPYHGITLCQGNFRLMTDDLPAAIRHFGKQRKIFFAHFRDVRGTPRKFVETFHDDGPTDMLACLKAYHDVGFDGVIRPDHVPTLEGDSNDMAGYSTMGRLFAIGYIKGLNESIVGKQGRKRRAKSVGRPNPAWICGAPPSAPRHPLHEHPLPSHGPQDHRPASGHHRRRAHALSACAHRHQPGAGGMGRGARRRQRGVRADAQESPPG